MFQDGENAEPEKTGRSKKRDRTSESDKREAKRAKAEEVEKAFAATAEAPTTVLVQAVPVSAEKSAKFQEYLNKTFMETREQVKQIIHKMHSIIFLYTGCLRHKYIRFFYLKIVFFSTFRFIQFSRVIKQFKNIFIVCNMIPL